MRSYGTMIFLMIIIALGGCTDGNEAEAPANEPEMSAETPAPEASAEGGGPQQRFGGDTSPLDMPADLIVPDPAEAAERSAYFGDLHVHTGYSFDAFAFGTVATPYDAYRYAKGEPLMHPAGFEMKMRRPLDFYAVTDHAMFLGAIKAASDTGTEFSKLPYVEYLHDLNAPENLNPGGSPERTRAFSTFLVETLTGILEGNIDGEMVNDIARNAWSDTIAAAEEFNEPGKFTTLVAYEYTTSSDDRGNLHRNVFFRDGNRFPAMPFSRFHDQNPEGLWDWMDDLREQGIESLAIPHNSNGSNGQMFKLVDWAGDPMDDSYADQRMRNEPLVEITQIKGTSDTHPMLSDNDEWADFEIMPYRIATTLYSEPSGSYVREALLNGLAFEDRGVVNPYKFGVIGSSDTHTAATSNDEEYFYGKIGLLDARGEFTGSLPLPEEVAGQLLEADAPNIKEIDGKVYRNAAPITWGSSGLAAVWAEENNREAIYNALRRKETFATTGPRIKVRFFGGYGFDEGMLNDAGMLVRAYSEGVAMGSDLLADGDEAPVFIAWASRDLLSAPLQRLQIIKGWTVDGEHHEMVYDVACSSGTPDPATHRCRDNGAQVNLSDCSISTEVGAAELKTAWRDPDFNPAHRAFYYVRALENPTCRWSTWDAVHAGVPPRPDIKATIQERAWSSPIWFVPEA